MLKQRGKLGLIFFYFQICSSIFQIAEHVQTRTGQLTIDIDSTQLYSSTYTDTTAE